MLVVQFILLTVNNALTAPGWDEWGHLPSGLYHLQFSEYRPYCVNPPLVRTVAAVPVWLAGGGFDERISIEALGFRPERKLAEHFFHEKGFWVFPYFFLAREALVPLSLFGTWLLFQVCRDLFGYVGAYAASILWAFSPMVLTYGPSITPDLAAAVAGLWCIMKFRVWIDEKTWRSVFNVGVAIFLCLATKFTWIIMPFLLIAIWLVDGLYVSKRSTNWQSDVKQITVSALVCLFLLNLLYEFKATGHPLGEFKFVSETLSGAEHDGSYSQFGNRFKDTWLESIPVPVPSLILEGVDIQRRDFESGLDSYLFGQRRNQGWYYYYIVGIFLKEPVAIWVLLVIAFFWYRGGFLRWSKHEVYTLLPGVTVLALVSSQTGFNHHLRYVLPAFLVLYVIAAKAASVSWHSRSGRTLVVACLLWYCLSSVMVVPRSYAFFSEVIGEKRNGWRYLDNSNLDWGQDLYTAMLWMYQHPNSAPFYVLYSLPQAKIESSDANVFNGRKHIGPHGLSSSYAPNKSGTWIVFSQLLTQPEGAWFRNKVPDYELSPTIRVFSVDRDLKTRKIGEKGPSK